VNRDPDERAQPDGVPADDEFEAIVAGWRREGRVPSWPDDPAEPGLFEPRRFESGRSATGRFEGDRSEPDPGLFEPGFGEPGLFDAAPARPPTRPDDDHYVPPEPPPLPPIGPPVMVGLALVGAGLLLLVGPGWLGVSEPYGLPLGLVAIAAGLGWLVLRLWPDPPDDGDRSRPGNGAVL
jgi:hypothetical protein